MFSIKTPELKPIRILHVTGSLGLGGAETLLYRLVSRPSKFEHRIVSLANCEWYGALLEKQDMPVKHLGIMSLLALPSGCARLEQLISQSGADIVHAWMYRANLLAGIAAKRSKTPVVWSVHSASTDALRLSSKITARLGGIAARHLADFVVNCSNAGLKHHERLGYGRAPGAVVHNGYDPQEFFPDPNTRTLMREQLSVDQSAFLVGSLTRWIGYKDVPTLLRALRIVRDRGVPVTCVLLGHRLDETNSELMQTIKNLDCVELVLPLGLRSDVRQLARAMDLHVLSSTTEAFPNAVAETMLSGTPNVVTNVGDSGLMVGKTGWVVPARDPEKLADAIESAWREKTSASAAWKRRRTAARQRIAENFNFEQMMRAYEQIWRSLAGGTSSLRL